LDLEIKEDSNDGAEKRKRRICACDSKINSNQDKYRLILSHTIITLSSRTHHFCFVFLYVRSSPKFFDHIYIWKIFFYSFIFSQLYINLIRVSKRACCSFPFPIRNGRRRCCTTGGPSYSWIFRNLEKHRCGGDSGISARVTLKYIKINTTL
jgi:hypothetical protein